MDVMAPRALIATMVSGAAWTTCCVTAPWLPGWWSAMSTTRLFCSATTKSMGVSSLVAPIWDRAISAASATTCHWCPCSDWGKRKKGEFAVGASSLRGWSRRPACFICCACNIPVQLVRFSLTPCSTSWRRSRRPRSSSRPCAWSSLRSS